METEQMTLNELQQTCQNCSKCDLYQTRTNVVFGAGNPDADIMFIGEGPGENEDIQALPFVGRSGRLLTGYLGAVGLDRKDVYITNIVKCRPPANRDPKPEEQETCIEYLKSQVRIINPKIIVCLGRIASARLIDKDFRVTKSHGEFIERKGYLMMGTYHPAALLRNSNLKFDALNDFKNIIQEIAKITKTEF
ncbi:MAG: uracil-DNA glycosylase [Oscillospiraceae bacterium]|nr:uracil-DNA glycosylase [Oscillospiraceae bacterium]